jgi:hypothetical protein
MASRQQEKEARRQARLEQEAAERRASSRQKRLQMVLAGVIAVGVIVAAVVLIAGGGGGKHTSAGDEGAQQASASGVKLPAQQTSDISAAVKASGCTLTHPPDEGRGHENKTFTAADYKTNPPTSGAHFPEWAQDGVYTPANTPPLGQLVHTLEHGRIDVQYKPGTSPQVVKQLEAFVAENQGYHMVMFQNPTGMKAQVAATAWTQSLTCNSVTPKMWDALRTFRDRYLDKGPEKIP